MSKHSNAEVKLHARPPNPMIGKDRRAKSPEQLSPAPPAGTNAKNQYR